MFDFISRYPTITVFLAMCLAAILTMVLMPSWIRFLERCRIGQQVRADGPESHLVKQGTPTMGGVVMLVAATVVTLIVSPGLDVQVVLLLVVMLGAGAIGLIDDASKVIRERSLGLTPKGKLIGQFALASVFTLCAVNYAGISPVVTVPFLFDLDLGVLTTVLPFGGGFSIPWLYLIFADILMVGMCNAVNLSDGLDGLAAGCVLVVMLVMAAIAYRLDLLGSAVFSGAVAGSCVGFLWFNTHPADIFMGDTGSLALGMGFGALAILTKNEVVSLIVGGLFVAEALSVMLQVVYYKKTRKRIFLMAPLHHHFEKKGWSETKVVVRFWIVSAFLSALGFSIYFAHSFVIAGL